MSTRKRLSSKVAAVAERLKSSKQSQFAQKLEGAQDGQSQLLSIFAANLNFDAALNDDQELIPFVALTENDMALGMMGRAHHGSKMFQFLGSEPSEQRNLLEKFHYGSLAGPCG